MTATGPCKQENVRLGRLPEPRAASRIEPRAEAENPHDADRERLQLSIARPGPNTVVLSAHGDVDMLTAPRLADMLSCRLRSVIDMLVLDLSGVAFLGTAGLSVLARAHLQAEHHGAALRVVTGQSHPVTRALAVAGLHRKLSLWPTVEVAVEGSPRGE